MPRLPEFKFSGTKSEMTIHTKPSLTKEDVIIGICAMLHGKNIPMKRTQIHDFLINICQERGLHYFRSGLHVQWATPDMMAMAGKIFEKFFSEWKDEQKEYNLKDDPKLQKLLKG